MAWGKAPEVVSEGSEALDAPLGSQHVQLRGSGGSRGHALQQQGVVGVARGVIEHQGRSRHQRMQLLRKLQRTDSRQHPVAQALGCMM